MYALRRTVITTQMVKILINARAFQFFRGIWFPRVKSISDMSAKLYFFPVLWQDGELTFHQV